MEKHTCKTYFVFQLNDSCNKDKVEQAIIDQLGVKPVFNRRSFEIGCNEAYSVHVSDMVRVTIKGLKGKEEEIIDIKRRFNLTTCLEIVPYIVADSEQSNQCLSLDDDIIEFLYKSGTAMDLDYYIV